MDFNNLDFWKQFDIKSVHYLERYLDLIKKLSTKQNRNLKTYEKHHIVPKSFIKNNYLLKVTPREHYILHWILSYCFDGDYGYKMQLGFLRLCTSSRKDYFINSKTYELLKIRLSEFYSEHNKGRIWINNGAEEKFINPTDLVLFTGYSYGRLNFSEECKRKMSEKSRKNVKLGINKGWGNCKNHNHNTTGGKSPVSNGNKIKFIKKEELENFLEKHKEYYKTSTRKGSKCREETKNKISSALKEGYKTGKLKPIKNYGKRSKEYNKGKDNAVYGKKAMNNGEITKFIGKCEIDKYLKLGWNFGYVKRRVM